MDPTPRLVLLLTEGAPNAGLQSSAVPGTWETLRELHST